MIQDINEKAREDIIYDTLKGVLLYHNTLAKYPIHWHNDVEIILLLSGTLRIKFHNDNFSDGDFIPIFIELHL